MSYKIVHDDGESIKIIVSNGEKKSTGKNTAIIRIGEDSYNALAVLSRLTTAPIGKLADACISHCIDNEKITIFEEN